MAKPDDRAAEGRPCLMMVRARPQSERFVAGLDPGLRSRLDPLLAPLMEMLPLPPPPPPGPETGLVLTSENAAAALPQDWPLAGRTAWCVGETTARAAAGRGLRPRVAAGTAEALVEVIAAGLPRGARLLYLRGRHRSADVAEALARHGVAVEEAEIYDQRALPLSPEARARLRAGGDVWLPLFSARTARLFLQEAAGLALDHVTALCLSPQVAAILPEGRVGRVLVAARPDAQAIAELLAGLSSPGPSA